MRIGIVWAACLLVLTGCTAPLMDESGQALAAANKTVEGHAFEVFQEAFAKTPQCTFDEYSRVAGFVGPLLESRDSSVSFPTDAQSLRVGLETAKACNPVISTEPVQNGNLWRVTYSVRIPSGCPLSSLSPQSQSLQVDVDLSTGEAVVVKGQWSSGLQGQVSGVLPAVGLLGNCTAPVVLQAGLLHMLVG